MKRSVVAYIGGGLGNQLFNYATARAMALDAGAELLLRPDAFVGDVYRRQFALDDFNCDYVLLKARSKPLRLAHHRFHERIKKMGRWRLWNTIVDRDCGTYHPMPRTWHGRVSIAGPWQSERYFVRHAERIARDFALKDDSWLRRDPVAATIRGESQSAFLHIRSYKDIPGFRDGSYALPLAYYENALRVLSERVGKAKVFVFSDDLPWAVARLGATVRANGFEMVPVGPDGSGLPAGRHSSSYLRDFSLMRLCRHGILADSTFSWWAGWLGEFEREKAGCACVRLRPARGALGGRDFWPERWVSVSFGKGLTND